VDKRDKIIAQLHRL